MGTLVLGLPDDSRYKKALAGIKSSTTDSLLALIVDRLSYLVWFKTKDGTKGRNRPTQITETIMFGKSEAKKTNVRAVESPEEFKKEWNRITKKGG